MSFRPTKVQTHKGSDLQSFRLKKVPYKKTYKEEGKWKHKLGSLLGNFV